MVKGLLINVAQTVLQALVLAVFASQYQQTIIDAATDAAQASCDAAGVDCTEQIAQAAATAGAAGIGGVIGFGLFNILISAYFWWEA